MGECLLVRRGGKASLKSITVKTPPAKLEYLAGDTFDATGLVLTALIGGVEVDVTTGYTITPTTLTADTTAVTITYALDGKTASTTQAVTVKAYDPVFANNTWEKIIEAAASGRASELWSVGDTKPYTIGDETYTARIIGFDHDALDSTDAKYGDASYNGGKNKAAITLEMVEVTSTGYKIHSSNSYNIGWRDCAMRSSTLPTLKGLIEETVRNAIRTVVKKRAQTPNCDNGKYYETPDELFLLSAPEYNRVNASWITNFTQEGTPYAYYTAGNSLAKKKINGTSNDKYWTSSAAHYQGSSYQFIYVNSDGTINSYDGIAMAKPISIAFCL